MNTNSRTSAGVGGVVSGTSGETVREIAELRRQLSIMIRRGKALQMKRAGIVNLANGQLGELSYRVEGEAEVLGVAGHRLVKSLRQQHDGIRQQYQADVSLLDLEAEETAAAVQELSARLAVLEGSSGAVPAANGSLSKDLAVI